MFLVPSIWVTVNHLSLLSEVSRNCGAETSHLQICPIQVPAHRIHEYDKTFWFSVWFLMPLFLGWFVSSNQQPLPGLRINHQPMRDRRLSIHTQLLYPLNVKVFHRVSQEFPSRTESSLSKEAINLWTYSLFAFIYFLLYFLYLWLCFPRIHLSNKLLVPKSLSQGLLLQKFNPRVDPFLFCWFLYRPYLFSMLFIENSFSLLWWVVPLLLQINCLLIIIFLSWLFYSLMYLSPHQY